MCLWFVIIIILDKNENKMCLHIIHNWWHPTINEKLVIYVTYNVLHMWLNNMHGVLFNLNCDYIIVTNVHVLIVSYYM
jgi:hypothetical protein